MKNSLGPLEHQIMKIVWKQKKSTVYSVIEELKEERNLAYTTVMTVMARLADKKILNREKVGKVYFYKPAQTKEKFIHFLIKKTIHSFIDKFGDEAVVAFIDETNNLSKSKK
jgi:predicted transcriptional regulator